MPIEARVTGHDSGRVHGIGLCGYADPTDDGSGECRASGLRITVRDCFGRLVSIVRCRQHSDWIEAAPEVERK
jgi:hypothetical protein